MAHIRSGTTKWGFHSPAGARKTFFARVGSVGGFVFLAEPCELTVEFVNLHRQDHLGNRAVAIGQLNFNFSLVRSSL